MDSLPLKQKTALAVPYLQQAGLLDTPPSCDTAPRLNDIIEATEQRMTVAGDILDYTDFFVTDDALTYDQDAYTKHITENEDANSILTDFRQIVESANPFEKETIEAAMRAYIDQKEIKFRAIVHPIRIALTGKTVGFSLFDTIALTGQESCLARLDRILQ